MYTFYHILVERIWLSHVMTLTFDLVSHHPHQQTLCVWRRHTTMSHNPNYAVSPSGEREFRYISVAHFRRDIIWWWCQRLTFTHIITWPKLRSIFLIHQPVVWLWIIANQLFTYGTVTQPCAITLTTQFHYHLLVPGPLSSYHHVRQRNCAVVLSPNIYHMISSIALVYCLFNVSLYSMTVCHRTT